MILTPCPGVLPNEVTSYTPTDGLEKLAQQLIPRVAPKFEQVHVWSYANTTENPEFPGVTHVHPGEATTAGMQALQQAVGECGITHLLLIGDSNLMNIVSSAELIYDRAERPVIYAWCCLPNPFVNHNDLRVANYFDFLVFTSDLERGAFSDGIAGLGPQVTKHAFTTTLNARTIRPGVDTSVFRPMETGRREFGREEIRGELFSHAVGGGDFLITVCGRNHCFSGVAQVMAMVDRLRDMVDRPVRLYLHMPQQGYENLLALAEGNELVLNTDIFIGDTFFGQQGQPMATSSQMNMIYNASSLVLSMEQRGLWPTHLLEAQAAAVATAGPEDHVWLDALYNKGLTLPTVLGSVNGDYRRVCDPIGAAQIIAEKLKDQEAWETLRERGISYAHSSEASWDRAATQWLRLFGLD